MTLEPIDIGAVLAALAIVGGLFALAFWSGAGR